MQLHREEFVSFRELLAELKVSMERQKVEMISEMDAMKKSMSL